MLGYNILKPCCFSASQAKPTELWSPLYFHRYTDQLIPFTSFLKIQFFFFFSSLPYLISFHFRNAPLSRLLHCGFWLKWNIYGLKYSLTPSTTGHIHGCRLSTRLVTSRQCNPQITDSQSLCSQSLVEMTGNYVYHWGKLFLLCSDRVGLQTAPNLPLPPEQLLLSYSFQHWLCSKTSSWCPELGTGSALHSLIQRDGFLLGAIGQHVFTQS